MHTSEAILHHQFNGRLLLFSPPGLDSSFWPYRKASPNRNMHALSESWLLTFFSTRDHFLLGKLEENDKETYHSICIESIILHKARTYQYSRTHSREARVTRLVSAWHQMRESQMKWKQLDIILLKVLPAHL